MNRVAAILLALSSLATSVPALANCDYESHQAGTHNGIVPQWSYSHSFRSTEPLADKCAREAESLACDQGEEGLECAYDMQRVYRACVADSVCDELVQGLLEDGDIAPEAAGGEYHACMLFVVTAAGNDCDYCAEEGRL